MTNFIKNKVINTFKKIVTTTSKSQSTISATTRFARSAGTRTILRPSDRMRTWSFGTMTGRERSVSKISSSSASHHHHIMYLLFLFTIQIRKHFLLMTFLFFKTCIDSIDRTLLEFAKCRCIIIGNFFCCCCCCVLADRLLPSSSILAFNPPNSFCILSISSLSLLCSFRNNSRSFERLVSFLVQKSLLGFGRRRTR